jgi:hypothetical protein
MIHERQDIMGLEPQKNQIREEGVSRSTSPSLEQSHSAKSITDAVARAVLSGVIEPVKNITKAQIGIVRDIKNKLDINRSEYTSYSDFISKLPRDLTSKLFSAFSLNTPVAKYIQTQARDKLKKEGLLDGEDKENLG